VHPAALRDAHRLGLCNWGQGFDDTALRDRVVLALVDELSQLDTKRGQIGKLAFHLIKVEPSDPVNLGARLGATSERRSNSRTSSNENPRSRPRRMKLNHLR
jgi:hypothetical protein